MVFLNERPDKSRERLITNKHQTLSFYEMEVSHFLLLVASYNSTWCLYHTFDLQSTA